MKHQQVVVDYWKMVKTSFTCLALVVSGYVLLKLVYAIFWLPSHLQRSHEALLKKLDNQLKKPENDDVPLMETENGESDNDTCSITKIEPADDGEKKDN